MMAVAMATGALITLVACGGDADVSDQDAADAEAEAQSAVEESTE